MSWMHSSSSKGNDLFVIGFESTQDDVLGLACQPGEDPVRLRTRFNDSARPNGLRLAGAALSSCRTASSDGCRILLSAASLASWLVLALIAGINSCCRGPGQAMGSLRHGKRST